VDRTQRLLNKTVELSILAMAVLIPVIFFTRANDVFEINKMFIFRVFTLVGVFMWLFMSVRDKKFTLVRTDLDFPVLGLLASSFLSVLITKNINVSIFGVYEDYEGIFTAVNYFFFYYLVVNFMGARSAANKMAAIVLLSTLIIAGYGLAQNFGWDFVKWNPETYSPDRFFSTLGNPNFLAAYLVQTIPVVFMLFFMNHDRKNKFMILAILAVAVVVVFLTKSRAGFLSFFITVVLMAVYSFLDARKAENELFSRNKNWFMAFGALMLLTLFVPMVRDAFVLLWDRSKALFTFKGLVLTPRVYIWKSALMMFRDNPVFGTGLDTFQVVFPYYRFPIYWQLEWNGTPEKTHNVFLQVLATQGIVGFGFYMLLFVTFLKKSYNLMFGERDMHKRYLIFGFFMSAAAFFVQGLFNYTVVAYGIIFWLALAMIMTLGSEHRRVYAYNFSQAYREFTDRNKGITYSVLCALCIVLSVLAAKYWAADLYFKIGNIAVASDKDEYSTPYYEKSVELAPEREIYWVKYGIGYEKVMRKEQNPEKKLAYIQQAILIHKHTMDMNPMNGYNYNNIARVYKYWGEALDRSKYQDAAKMYDEAIKRDPNNAYFGLDQSSVYISMSEWDKAFEIAKRYSELYPDFAVPESYMGYIYMLQGTPKMAEARYYYEQALARPEWHKDAMTQASTYSNLGIIYFNLKMVKEAVDTFNKVIEIRPDYLEGYLNLGKLYQIMKDRAKAMDMYERAMKINPDDTRAAGALQQMGIKP
jgi:O-antigen ligase/Tfp pilus assembly protein PilF